jgi:pimeloyl-ACP methyl ester carboxylesterase
MPNAPRTRRAGQIGSVFALTASIVLIGCATVDTSAPKVVPIDATASTVASTLPEITPSTPDTTAATAPSNVTTAPRRPTTTAPTKAQKARPSLVAWGDCDSDVFGNSGVDESLLDCATVPVPVDYAHPDDGKQINVAMVRYKSSGAGDYIGSLLLNPGGPGASGRELLVSVVATEEGKLADLHDHFDMIGFDPRGVDGSSGLVCADAATLDEQFQVDITPETPEEKAFAKGLSDRLDNACLAKYGEAFLKQISTEATARDMDRIRIAVGDDKLTYLGISYGTYLGAAYATLFPDKVRALVLDGAYDPIGDDDVTNHLIQETGFEAAFKNWVEWCSTSAVCAFGGPNVDQRWLALRQSLDDKPIKGDGKRTVNQGTFLTATVSALYQKAFLWPVLGAALRAAEQGDGSLLLTLADSQSGRKDDGSYNSLDTAFSVIMCASGISSKPPADHEAAAAAMRKASPHFGFATVAEDFDQGSCDKLPSGPPAAPFSYAGGGPILVIGGKNDPATPFQWAEKMAKDLGPKASLLAYAGEGHSTWLESDCADAAIYDTLVDLLTVGSKACAAQPVASTTIPTWLSELPAVPNPASVTIDDLTPLLTLDQFGLDGRIAFTTLTKSAATKAVETSLVAAGWKSLGGQNGARSYSRKVGGETQELVVLPFALTELAAASPAMKQIADKLNESGKTVLVFGTPI